MTRRIKHLAGAFAPGQWAQGWWRQGSVDLVAWKEKFLARRRESRGSRGREIQAVGLSPLRLEPRRVLSATIQTLIVPAIATEGETVDVSAEAKGGPGLMFDWTVTRDTQVIETGSTQDFSFVPPDDGLYRVDLKVTDPSDETMDTGSALLIVDNVAPKIENLVATNIQENESTTLTGTIVDPGEDTFALEIDWGDPDSPGNVQTIDLTTPTPGVEFNDETGEFAIQHQYLDDNPTGMTDATYTISVTVSDDDEGQSMASTTVEVANVRPTISDLSAIDISENGTTTLSGRISDPGTRDTFELEIDWGDPLSPGNIETIDLNEPGERVTFDAETGEFTVKHQYLDDNPTGESGATYTIGVTATDDDRGATTATTNINVANVAPQLKNLAAIDIDEDGVTTLSGKIADQGTLDTFTLTVNWGDGRVEDYTFAAGVREFSIDHQYLDDPAGLPDQFEIRLTLVDDDLDMAVDAVNVGVANVPPVIQGLRQSAIFENQSTVLTGTIRDPGTLDTFQLEIDWGDPLSPGNIQTIDLTAPEEGVTFDPKTGVFSVEHQYLDDNPTGTASDLYTVKLTAKDDDGGVSPVATTTVKVFNVAPQLVEVTATNLFENGETMLAGRIIDPGTLDTFTLKVDWGDGSAVETFTYAAGTTTFNETHQYLDDNPTGTPSDPYKIKLTLMDDDTGEASALTVVTVTNVKPEFDAIPDATIDEGGQVVISLLSPPGGPAPGDAIVAATFTDVGTLDTHWATVNWGDGAPTEPILVAQGMGGGALEGAHTYADNGTYNVTLMLTDDDGGKATQFFIVKVNNVAPELTLELDSLTVNEGETFAIENLGTFSDPGYDNLLNSTEFENGGETRETFTYNIDWGDGTARELRLPVITTVGAPGIPTSGILTKLGQPASHTYADNGEYTVTVTLRDDDGGVDVETFLVTVNNVAPKLQLSNEVLTLDAPGKELLEGDTITIHRLGIFSDPGFDNPLNRPEFGNGGEKQETFTYSIDWGDGTVQEFTAPATTRPGRPGVLTTGSLIDAPIQHHYLDNDTDGVYDSTYHVKVTLRDDDGGETVETFAVTVLNVNPSLNPVTATDLESAAITTLTLSFSDPGAVVPAPGETFPSPGTEVFTVQVDWENDGTFVAEQMHAGPTPETFAISHRFRAPPNPNNPAADITITVMVQDDDFGSGATSVQGAIMSSPFVPGQSNMQSVTISNPGIEDNNVAIDTTPEIAALEFPGTMDTATSFATQTNEEGVLQPPDLRAVAAEISATADRYFELRPVTPEGEPLLLPNGELVKGVKLAPDVMENLPQLFAKLPDYRYQIWLVRTENNSQRLVLDFIIRNGRPIDPADDTEGARDRPPTSEEAAVEPIAPVEPTNPAEPADAAGEQDPEGDARIDALPTTNSQATASPPPAIPGASEQTAAAWKPATPTVAGSLTAGSLALAGLLVQSRRRAWADEVEESLETASEEQWRRLRWRNLPR